MPQIGQFTRETTGFTGRVHTLTLYREPLRLFSRFVEILAVLYEPCAQDDHRLVLFGIVPIGHDNGHRHVVTRTGKRQTLTVIASGSGNNPNDISTLASQTFNIDETAPDLESACGQVILMFDDGACSKLGR